MNDEDPRRNTLSESRKAGKQTPLRLIRQEMQLDEDDEISMD